MEAICYTVLILAGIALIAWSIHCIYTNASNLPRSYGTDMWDTPMYTSYSFTETITKEAEEKDSATKGDSDENLNDPPISPDTRDSGSRTCQGR